MSESFGQSVSKSFKKASFFQQYIDQDEQIQDAKEIYDGDNFDEQESFIRQSFIKKNQNSSITTIFAIVNLMVGSIVLLIPVNFGTSGILMSLIVMSVIGIVSCISCYWLVTNTRPHENDVSQVLTRILGKSWATLFTLSSACLLFCISIIFFILINQTFWQIMEFFFANAGYTNYADPNVMTWDKYSVQWQSIILIFVLFPLLCLKKPSFIVKLAGYGVIALYIYIIFIFYIFFQNVHDKNLSSENVKSLELFPSNLKTFGAIIGNFAVAFQCHNAVTQITSSNKNKNKNGRDVSLAFVTAFVVYIIIGVIGCFGLLGREPYEVDPDLIYGYFEPKNVVSFIVEVVFLVNLVTVFPLLCFISKSQFFSIVLKDKKTPNLYLLAFNIVLSIVCLLVLIFNVNIDIVIGLAGNAIGYIIVYLTPSALIYQVKYRKHLISEISNPIIEEEDSNEKYLLKENVSDLKVTEFDGGIETEQKESNQETKDMLFKIFLACFNLLGLSFAVISIVLIFM